MAEMSGGGDNGTTTDHVLGYAPGHTRGQVQNSVRGGEGPQAGTGALVTEGMFCLKNPAGLRGLDGIFLENDSPGKP